MMHAVFAALVAACGGSASAARVPVSNVVELSADDIGTVEARRVLDGPIVSGTLAAASAASVRAELVGTVAELRADAGTRVEAGTLLARLDDHAQRAAHASALAGVRTATSAAAVAERRAARLDALLAAGAVSAEEAEVARQSVAAADAELQAARARLASAATELSRAEVRSPIAGVVSARAAARGEAVQPGAPLFEVLDPSTMRLEAAVPAASLGAVHVGAPVRFTVTGYPGRTFTGRVQRVGVAADPATRQVPLVVTLDNRDGRLVAGLFAEGRLTADERDALVVPAAAVDGDGPRATVLQLRAGRLVKVAVEAGGRHAERGTVEIVSGLRRGDTVVVGTTRGVAAVSAARVSTPNGSR
jgi:RND family efflux transporter MFP subunit